jgi:HlyD family secretion protein/epimerase transport system membrane fusion protein
MKKNLPAIPPGARPPVPQPSRTTVSTLKRATHAVDRLANHIIPYDPNQSTPEQRARPTIMVGIGILIFLFGFIGLWAALVPLASGAVAPGRVVLDSNRKTIQHLEGGIVKEILVKENDVVQAGQVLVRLDNTNAQARSDMIRGQYVTAQATQARLQAEQAGKDTVDFPAELTSIEATDPKVHEVLETQRRLFSTRKEALSGQIGILNQKISQTQQEIRGLQEQVTAANSQIALLNEEIDVVRGLLAKGNALKPRLLALERSQADMLGQRGNAMAMISRANQTINEAKISIINEKTDYLNKATAEMKETQTDLSNLTEQGRAATDVTSRIEVKAPAAGKVTGLMVHTIGGVVQPGETLMTLVPTNDKLIVEAHISPTDIDVVHDGLSAQVRLTAFHMRYLRPVTGTVTTVSADRFDDQRTGEGYYLARIEIPQSELVDLGNITLTLGMPAETLIVTGRRTMLSYLVRPIRDSFGHAFHEQ